MTVGSGSPSARTRPGGALLPALLILAFALLAGLARGSFARSPAPCGTAARPKAGYRHVLVVVMENHSFSQVADSSPYLNGLARRCGLATSYFAITHPSLPNYLALTSGSTQGITDDCTSCSASARSIFEQLRGDWRSYLESMPSPGYQSAYAGTYAKKHNPAAYYTRIARAYARDAVPLESPSVGLLLDLRRNSLARFSLIVPNLCHDEHDCSIATGDAWLGEWIPRILQSRAYRAGQAVLFVTYDEGTGQDNHVYTVVASPSTPAGQVAYGAFDHYALLRTVEGLLGLHCLGHACDRSSMRAAFRL